VRPDRKLSVDPRMEPLADLARDLENLLALFGGERCPSPAALEALGKSVEASHRALREVNESLDDRTVAPEVGERLDRVRRLQSVALAMAASEKESVGRDLENLLRSKRKLGARGESGVVGGACDLSA